MNCFLYKRGQGSGGGGSNRPVVVKTALGSVISLTDSTNGLLKGLRIFGKTTQNGTPSPDAPVPLESVGDDGNVAVTVCGKNLFNPALLSQVEGYNTFDEATGIWTTNADKNYFRSFLYNVSGNSTNRDVTKLINVLPNTQMACKIHDLSFSEDCTDHSISVSFCDENGEFISNYLIVRQGAVYEDFTTPEQCHYIDIRRAYNGGTISFSSIQLEFGSDATAYEPYKGQSATFDTPNGLLGVPASSGGNYTDRNGQIWVCDEIDGARGVRVHRACVESFDGSADEKISYTSESSIVTNGFVSIELSCNCVYAGARYKPNLLCDRLLTVVNNYSYLKENSCTISSAKNKLTILSSDITSVASAREWLALHPIKVVYEMETPIETPLSAEELAQYAALHTNYPNTTIFNDEGAYMEVKYTSGG